MKALFTIAVIMFLIVLSEGCYYDKSELLYPKPVCDSTNTGYTVSVKPIINNYCLACHGYNNYNSLGGNLNLEGYNNLLIPVRNGVLLKSIHHSPGVSPMPKNAGKLSACNIAIIEKWIASGALNN